MLNLRSLLAVPVACLLLASCGSDQTLTLPPQVEVTIDGQNKTAYEFKPDQTRGQIGQKISVLIKNTGGGPLSLTNINFKTQNVFLSLGYPKAKPSYPFELVENASVQLDIRYQPDPNIENASPGVLEISHNDADKPSPIKLTFTIAQTGARIDLQEKSHTFINPSKFNPPTQCFGFGNKGNAALEFKGASFGTATAFYTITSQPNVGDTISATGEADNPKNNPKLLKVCVRLTPGSTELDYQTQLIIETSDKTNSKAKVLLDARWEKTNVFKISSDHPQGLHAYDFTGVTGGSKTRCLNVYNEGPAGWLLNTVEIVAHNSAEQSAADAQYSVELNKIVIVDSKPTSEKVNGTPFSVNASKSLNICLTYTVPNDSSAPVQAFVRWNYSQANVPDKAEFPVISGACDTPLPVFGPSATPLWQLATVSTSSKATVVIANQSCAPLTIMKGCVTQASAPGTPDPCQVPQIASQHFKLPTDITLKTIPAWGLMAIEVEFVPPNANYKNVNHLLNILYCSGPFDSSTSTCGGGGLVNRPINIGGHIGDDVKRPDLKLAIAEGSETKVGSPLKIDALATAGDYPISEYGGYLWMLKSRPAGSKTWLSSDLQVTDEPWITIKPDVEGKYELVGATQSVKTGTSDIAWSTQVLLELNVTK